MDCPVLIENAHNNGANKNRTQNFSVFSQQAKIEKLRSFIKVII